VVAAALPAEAGVSTALAEIAASINKQESNLGSGFIAAVNLLKGRT
jgi:hypothetical protein